MVLGKDMTGSSYFQGKNHQCRCHSLSHLKATYKSEHCITDIEYKQVNVCSEKETIVFV